MVDEYITRGAVSIVAGRDCLDGRGRGMDGHRRGISNRQACPATSIVLRCEHYCLDPCLIAIRRPAYADDCRIRVKQSCIATISTRDGKKHEPLCGITCHLERI